VAATSAAVTGDTVSTNAGPLLVVVPFPEVAAVVRVAGRDGGTLEVVARPGTDAALAPTGPWPLGACEAGDDTVACEAGDGTVPQAATSTTHRRPAARGGAGVPGGRDTPVDDSGATPRRSLRAPRRSARPSSLRRHALAGAAAVMCLALGACGTGTPRSSPDAARPADAAGTTVGAWPGGGLSRLHPAARAPTTTTTTTTAPPITTTAPPRPTATTTAPARPPTTTTTTRPPPAPLLVTRLVGVGSATQVVAVVAPAYGDTVATFTAYQETNGAWQQAFGPWAADIGYNGFAPPGQKHEGDGRTPSGSFGFSFAFGVDPDPGVLLPFRAVTGPSIVWDDDPASPLYNQWVDTTTANAGAAPEPMDQVPAYGYGAVIAYNTDPVVPGAGSAIFLHVSTGAPTLGCVALPTGELLAVLRWLDPAAQPRIVMGIPSTVAP